MLDLLEKQGRDPAKAELEKIAYPEQQIPSRKSLPAAVRLSVFERDHFHCLYCKRKVIFTPVLHLLGRLYPDIFPYTPYWRGGKTHLQSSSVAQWSIMSSPDPGEATGWTWATSPPPAIPATRSSLTLA